MGARSVRAALIAAGVAALTLLGVTPAHAGAEQGDPSKVGDLTGNLSGVVYVLIPLALLLALVTAIALGARGAPDPTASRRGGVSRVLSRRESADPGHPT